MARAHSSDKHRNREVLVLCIVAAVLVYFWSTSMMVEGIDTFRAMCGW